jgi:hypothetical protein
MLKSRLYHTTTPKQQTITTLKLIGQTIQDCTGYLPIRQYAAKVAARALPKDYIGQVQAIYDDFVQHWRYVRDPVGVETLATDPEAVYKFVIGANGGLGEGMAGEDCDGATVAIGAMLQNVGFPVRIVTTTPRNARPGSWFTHVFPETLIPGIGWITVDPVLYPREKTIGAITPHRAIAYWNLTGQKIGHSGPIPTDLKGANMHGTDDYQHTGGQWQDYGLAGTGDEYPEDWRMGMVSAFGGHCEAMGYTDGEGLGIHIEAEPIEYNGEIYARTPMIELAPKDYQYIQETGSPYIGMLALGDTGDIYEYDPQFGGFRKWMRKIGRKIKKGARRLKKGIKRGFKRIGKGIKKFIRKLPGGKYLIRLGKKLLKVGMKLIKPLRKWVGKYAKYLAPIAAMIPGVGPAVAVALHKAGKVAKMMNKFGVTFKSGPRGSKQLKFKSKKQAQAFKAQLKRTAIAEANKRKRRTGRARPRQPVRGRVIRAGSPQYKAVIRGMVEDKGFKVV